MTPTVRAIALCLLAALLLPGCAKQWSGDAADFTFTTHEGKTAKLSDYAGKPVVLNFWADWCPPCVGEFPEFQAAYTASGGTYTLISITDSSSRDPKGFVASKGYDWVFGISDEALRLYELQGLPTTLFIDSAGNIRDKQIGGMDRAAFETKVGSIL